MYGHMQYIVVMGNVLYNDGLDIKHRYDLKGSWINRHAKKADSTQGVSKGVSNNNLHARM